MFRSRQKLQSLVISFAISSTGRLLTSLSGIIYALTVVSSAQAICIQPSVNYPSGREPRSTYAADLDGDGDLDLVTANSGGGDVSILRNNGDGTFAAPLNYFAGGSASAVFAADLDGDSDLDLAIAESAFETPNVWILKNNGDGSFDAGIGYPTESGARCVYAADLDGDGDLDLAVVHNGLGIGHLWVLKNAGDGSFAAGVSYYVGDIPTSVIAADLDGDGDLDLASANENAGDVWILSNDGVGNFPLIQAYTTGGPPWSGPQSLIAADLDEDGNIDLAVARSNTNDVAILKNDGSGHFAASGYYGAGGSPISVVASDIDGDNDLDLAIANYTTDNISILLNFGDGSFAAAENHTVGDSPWSVLAGDLDGDCDPDLAVSNRTTDNISLLINCMTGDDVDSDGFTDGCDNCPTVSNLTQRDGDLDGVGDVCDSLVITAYSPVDLIVINPDSTDSIGPGFNTFVSGAEYDTLQDFGVGPNGVIGELDDRVAIFPTEPGQYRVRIVPELNLGPADTSYFLGVRDPGGNVGGGGWVSVNGANAPYVSDTPIANPLPGPGLSATILVGGLCAQRRGDFNADGLFTVVDVVRQVGVIFRNEPFPDPNFIADVNSDGTYDVLDVVRLVGVVFRNQPPPGP